VQHTLLSLWWQYGFGSDPATRALPNQSQISLRCKKYILGLDITMDNLIAALFTQVQKSSCNSKGNLDSFLPTRFCVLKNRTW
jgi:hypothetical protein